MAVKKLGTAMLNLTRWSEPHKTDNAMCTHGYKVLQNLKKTKRMFLMYLLQLTTPITDFILQNMDRALHAHDASG